MIHIVSNSASLDGQTAMGSGMHPAPVMGLHLQCVDEGFDSSRRFQKLDEAVLINASSQ